ncbi:MAG: hypothetical protein U0935_13245 [Pirellulales bacterium]
MASVLRISWGAVLLIVGVAGLCLLMLPQAAGQVPGGPTGWGWCAICGRDVYLPTHSHASGNDDDDGSAPSVPDTYGIVRLWNKTSQAVTYQLCSTYDYAWQSYTIEPGKGYYHWYRPYSRFSVVFFSNGQRHQYGLDGNFVRGRVPGKDESRDYDFVPDGPGFDLKTGSNRPFAPTAADREREEQRRQQEEARAAQRQAAERSARRAEAQQRIKQAWSEAETAYYAHEYEKAVAGWQQARSLALAHADLNPTWDDADCQRWIAQAWAMYAREAALQGKLSTASGLFEKALAATSDPDLRREWQAELQAIRARLANEQSFTQAVESGNAALQRQEYAAAARHFEAALAIRSDLSVSALLATAQTRVREQVAADLRARLAATAERPATVPPPSPILSSPFPSTGVTPGRSADQGDEHPLADILTQIVPDFAARLERETSPAGAVASARPLDLDWSDFLGPEPGNHGVTTRDPRPLEDPALAALLAGHLPSSPERERLERADIQRREQLRPPDVTTLFIQGEPRARQRINTYYLALLDEATRQASWEFAQEMRRLEDSGLLPRDAPFLKKLASDPALAAAVQAAGKRVIEHYLERRRDALCETEQLLHEVTVRRGTDPAVARQIADAQTRLAWEVSQRLQDARRRADRETVATIQRLTQAGILRTGISLRQQAEQDAVAQQALLRYVAPIESRCLAEQEQIERDHQRQLDEQIAAIRAAALATGPKK